MEEGIDPAMFSRYSRSMRIGLQNAAISVGSDDDMNNETKGIVLSTISLLEAALRDAFELQLPPPPHTPALEPLSR
jgi:hypothetical protein